MNSGSIVYTVLNCILKLSVLSGYSQPFLLQLFRELNKLDFNFFARLDDDNFERSYSQNDFDLLTSSDLDLRSRSLKLNQLVPGLCPTIA